MRDKALLGDVCSISMGQAPVGTSYNEARRGTPLIAGAGDFGCVSPEVTKYTTEPTKISEVGDIILCVRATIGDLNWSDREYCLGRGVAGLKANPKRVDQRYLRHYMESVAPILKSKGRGATFLQINKKDISTLMIPLPPLAEQKRIAAILDAADELRAKRRESIAQLDVFLQSTFIEMFGDPVANPKGWETWPLLKVASLENGDRSSNYPSGEELIDRGVLFLSTKNIVGSRLLLDDCKFISQEKFDALSRGKLQRKDIVITLRGTLGSCAVFDCEYDTGFINAQILIIRPREIDSVYLHHLLSSKQMRDHFKRIATGVAVKQLTGKQIGELIIQLPHFRLQHRFAAIVESVEQLKARMRAHLAELDALFASLQHCAFNGEL